ncbi:WhiB family transcriptional regulator [Streptomyces sp. NPDC002513]
MHIEANTAPDIAWQEQALCAQTGADFFFPEPGSSVREAKRICELCAIRSACLEYALAHDERFGVWGGLSEKERLHLRRGPENGRGPAGPVGGYAGPAR